MRGNGTLSLFSESLRLGIRGGEGGAATKLIAQAEEILESTFLLTEDYERFFVIYHNWTQNGKH